MKKVLVVDDRIHTLKGLIAILTDEGYEVITAAAGEEALELRGKHPDLEAVLADLKMPGMSGLELYKRMAADGPPPPFIIMTAYGSVRSAVAALKEGVAEYLIKPLDYEELILVLGKAVKERAMSRELDQLRRRVHDENAFHDMIGASPQMRAVYDLVRTVGPTDASVLIRGETGAGKELLARAIHRESPRRDRDMVCINCAALTESLLEAELFGYVKGAFTGAVADKKGRLEAAHQGALFLDEIGRMSLNLQAKLLRFLQEMTFEPVGSDQPRRVDVRLITATNQDLRALIDAGEFLPDLLYRIEVIAVDLPPLRERQEDAPLLVEHFVSQFAQQYGKPVSGVTPEAMETLSRYPWPGNVREMKNCLARAVILGKGGRLSVDDLPDKIKGRAPGPPPSGLIDRLPKDGARLQDMESELIAKTLAQCGGNKSLAAKRLGISRKALYQKIERLGVKGE